MFVESSIQASLYVLRRSVTGYCDSRNVAKLSNRIDKTYTVSISVPLQHQSDYCRERWNLERAHACRLVSAAQVTTNLSPIGDILPANIEQTRPLASLEPDQQREVIGSCRKRGPGRGIAFPITLYTTI
ncbi:MAG: hypothetical protein WBZ19_18020, partial [Chthoniobacterales bacterium]